jgi:hypothetical protein
MTPESIVPSGAHASDESQVLHIAPAEPGSRAEAERRPPGLLSTLPCPYMKSPLRVLEQ